MMSTPRRQRRTDDFAGNAETSASLLPAPKLRAVLNTLAVRAALALRLGDELLERPAGRVSVDCHRDVLHLRARIEGISRQIEDALAALDRIEGRQGKDTADRPRRTNSGQESVKTGRRHS